MNLSQLPNLISIARIILVVPLVVLLWQSMYEGALWIFFIAAISDGLDGFLARRYHWESPLGRVLDPIGDKVLLVATYLCLAWQGWLPVWLAALVVARDLIIVTGAISYYHFYGRYRLIPSWLSKVNTFFQLLLPLLMLAGLAGIVGEVDGFWLQSLIVIVAITTVLSGVNYVWVWGRKAWGSGRGE